MEELYKKIDIAAETFKASIQEMLISSLPKKRRSYMDVSLNVSDISFLISELDSCSKEDSVIIIEKLRSLFSSGVTEEHFEILQKTRAAVLLREWANSQDSETLQTCKDLIKDWKKVIRNQSYESSRSIAQDGEDWPRLLKRLEKFYDQNDNNEILRILRRTADNFPQLPDRNTQKIMAPLINFIKRIKDEFPRGEIKVKAGSIIKMWNETFTGKKEQKNINDILEKFRKDKDIEEAKEQSMKKKTNVIDPKYLASNPKKKK